MNNYNFDHSKDLTIEQLDAIKKLNEGLKEVSKECGLVEVIRKINLFLNAQGIDEGVWEAHQVMTAEEVRAYAAGGWDSTGDTAWGINYGNEVGPGN
jgi:hypothetical protein